MEDAVEVTGRWIGSDDQLKQLWTANHVAPLWESKAAHGKSADGGERAHIWQWRDMQRLIDAATKVRSMEAIERRVLSLIGPGVPQIGGAAGTTRNLNAGLQILMPGESARPHRHSMNALRFVLSGSGATTVVDGKSCPMEVGDLVTTPGWCWHEHIHEGGGPIVWLDVLDASLHRYLGTDSFQPGPATAYPAWPSDHAFTSSLMVPETAARTGAYSPVFRYPRHEAVEAVARAPIGRDGAKRVRYANPLSGGPVMPFLDCWLVELSGSVETVRFRTNASSVCSVVEGEGASTIGPDVVLWEARDTFTVPAGKWVQHQARSGLSRLFVVSDREVFRRLDLLKEEYSSET